MIPDSFKDLMQPASAEIFSAQLLNHADAKIPSPEMDCSVPLWARLFALERSRCCGRRRIMHGQTGLVPHWGDVFYGHRTFSNEDECSFLGQ
eukprot:8356087-Pyramimonas_sp.AAC.1